MSSTSATGTAKPARRISPARSRSSGNGDTRGDTPPVSAASACGQRRRAARPACRAPARWPGTNRPAAARWRIWISAPGRSLTQCSDRLATTRSKLAGANGSHSSSAATQGAPLQRGHPGRQVGADHLDPARPQQRRDHAAAAQVERLAGTPAWCRPAGPAAARRSPRSTGATRLDAPAARSRCSRTARRSKIMGSGHRAACAVAAPL